MNTCQSSDLSGPVFIDSGLAGYARTPERRVLGISSFPRKRESRGRRVLRLPLDACFRACAEMPFVGADLFVIPGWPAGSDPEPMNTVRSQGAAGLCSWLPGSRAAPAPRNDEYLGCRFYPIDISVSLLAIAADDKSPI